MMTIDDSRISELCNLWHEAGRAVFEKSFENLDYNGPSYQHYAKDRSKYIALDQGGSGYYLIDKETEQIYSIKAYGVPNKKRPQGTVDEVIAKLKAVIANGGLRDYHYWKFADLKA